MQRKEVPKEILGLNRITKKRILELCRKDKLYQTPQLNDVLYLHYQGFDCIECLEDYTELKCLWLECNAISEIKGLEKQTKLKCLFLQSNLIRKMENLEYCRDLDTLNLAQNHIRKIENCGFKVLPVLNTLNLASNYLKDCESLKELENCKNLSVLDLSNNRIEDILIVKIFAKMPELKVLVLHGNPVVSKIPQYRKTLILECKQLTYLDSRPVFSKDRACAEAWKRGGYTEERKENERWNRKERKKMRDSVNATIHLRNKNRKLEDQVSLIPSSDSEEDTNKLKSNLTTSKYSESYSYCMWDEVTEDKSSQLSSDISNENNNDVDNEDITKDRQNGEEVKLQDFPHKIFSAEQELVSELERSSSHSSVGLNSDSQAKHQIDCSLDHNETYEDTVKAIENITKSEHCLQHYIEKQIGNDELNEEENYEPLKEVEQTMNMMMQDVEYGHSSSKFEAKEQRPPRQSENEEECVKINNQLKTDFDKLTANLSNFVNRLEKEHEERQEVIKALFTTEVTTEETKCESSEAEKVSDKFISGMVLGHFNNGPKINKINVEDEVMENLTGKEISEQNIIEGEPNDNFQDNISNLQIDHKEFEVNRNSKSPKNVYNESFRDTEYISALTRKSNDALNSLERESEELKRLLQTLENYNEDLFKDTNSQQVKNQLKNARCEVQNEVISSFKMTDAENLSNNSLDKNIENDNNEYNDNNTEYNSFINEEYEMKTDKKDQKQFTNRILEDILQSLDLVRFKEKSYDQKQFVNRIIDDILQSVDMVCLNKKSYVFPDDLSESSEEFQSQCLSAKSIPHVIREFDQFVSKIELNRQKKEKNYSPELVQEKSIILKELSQQTNLKQFNADTLQTLDAQLEKIKRNQHDKVRRMVDRVYTQKDRYDDTLELIDNKLMVRNRKTNELQELQQQQNTSDSEEGYDTALSEEEEKSVDQHLARARFRSKSLKRAPHTSGANFIIDDLIRNNLNTQSDGSETSEGEFCSLDDYDQKNLYSIDKEFFNKLTFDLSNFTHADENHIAQCAQSYEELKHCFTLGTEARRLTEEDSQLLQNMSKGRFLKNNENSENAFNIFQNNSDLIGEELWKTCAKEVKQQDSKEDDGVDYFDMDRNAAIMMEKPFLKNILKEKFSGGCFAIERHSEEEKNEIENNIDFEECATCTKNLNSEEKTEISTTEAILWKSSNNYSDMNILDYSLNTIPHKNRIMD